MLDNDHQTSCGLNSWLYCCFTQFGRSSFLVPQPARRLNMCLSLHKNNKSHQPPRAQQRGGASPLWSMRVENCFSILPLCLLQTGQLRNSAPWDSTDFCLPVVCSWIRVIYVKIIAMNETFFRVSEILDPESRQLHLRVCEPWYLV